MKPWKAWKWFEDLPATYGAENGWLMATESSVEICTQMALKFSPNGKSENDKYFYYLLVYIIFWGGGLFLYFYYFIKYLPSNSS